MWPVFINATLEAVPGAEEKVAFDKFRHQEAQAVDGRGPKRPQEDEIRLAIQLAEHEPGTEAAFQGPARICSQKSPSVGHQGVIHLFVGLCQQDLGPQGLESVAVMDSAMSPGTGQEGGSDHQGRLVRHSERYRARGYPQW